MTNLNQLIINLIEKILRMMIFMYLKVTNIFILVMAKWKKFFEYRWGQIFRKDTSYKYFY